MALSAKNNRRDRKAKQEALDEATKEDTTRLNAVIPVSLHSKVKIQATQERRTITDIVVEALNEYLSKNSNE